MTRLRHAEYQDVNFWDIHRGIDMKYKIILASVVVIILAIYNVEMNGAVADLVSGLTKK